MNLAIPHGDLLLKAKSKSTADSGEVTEGESVVKIWARQVPNLIYNQAISHGLKLKWNEVSGADFYEIQLTNL
mgnify:CR=1 FL=1